MKIKPTKNILLLILSLFFSVFITEIGLRFFTQEYLTYFEQVHGKYVSYYQIYKQNQLSYPQNDTLVFQSKNEYSYLFTTNSLGYCDKEWAASKNKDKIRILCLGDSFTLGMGAPMGSSWVDIFRQKLLSKGEKVETLNAGISGSDIVNEVHKAKNLSSRFQPDAIVLCLNVSDIVDIYLRGGSGRFDSKEKNNQAINPLGKWEIIYQYSFIYRVYTHKVKKRDFLFLTPDEEMKLEHESVNIISAQLKQLKQYCSDNKILFYFFIHPHGMELIDGNYLYKSFPELRKGFESISSDFMVEFQKLESELMSYNQLFYKKDRHFTALGYYYLGNLVAKDFKNYYEKSLKVNASDKKLPI